MSDTDLPVEPAVEPIPETAVPLEAPVRVDDSTYAEPETDPVDTVSREPETRPRRYIILVPLKRTKRTQALLTPDSRVRVFGTLAEARRVASKHGGTVELVPYD